MALTLSKSGITTGQTVETWHVTQSIDAFTGLEAYDITLSGSLEVTGSINGTPGLINNLTASYAITSSMAVSSSYAVTASYALNGGGSGIQKVTLQFGHATVANAPSTPTYFGNYQTQPNTNVGRIAISSPIDGVIVSVSVDLYTVNPGASNPHQYKVYKDILTSPVATTLSGTTNSNINYSSFSEILSSPLNVSAGTPINIEWIPSAPESGLDLNHNVTLVIQPS